MKKFAVFISRYGLGNSPSILNFLDLLSADHQLTVFLEHVSLADVDLLKRRNVRVYDFTRRRSLSYWQGRVNALWSRYDSYVTFDPHGFCLCMRLFPAAQPIYYSLELYLREDHFGLYYPEKVCQQERANIGRISGLIIQSKEKEELFREDYGIAPSVPSLLLPVTYRGESSAEKTNYLRDYFGLPSGVRIALHLGGIAAWFSCVELAEAFGKLDGWVLVFHGYPDPDYEGQLQGLLKDKGIDNVYIHDRRFPDIEAVNEVIKSADVGIAWYNDLSAGFRTSGLSSGKIPAYLRFGLPVIAKRYLSTHEALEVPRCGFCVDEHDEIPQALTSIEVNYDELSRAARAEYEKRYRFEGYAENILTFLSHASYRT